MPTNSTVKSSLRSAKGGVRRATLLTVFTAPKSTKRLPPYLFLDGFPVFVALLIYQDHTHRCLEQKRNVCQVCVSRKSFNMGHKFVICSQQTVKWKVAKSCPSSLGDKIRFNLSAASLGWEMQVNLLFFFSFLLEGHFYCIFLRNILWNSLFNNIFKYDIYMYVRYKYRFVDSFVLHWILCRSCTALSVIHSQQNFPFHFDKQKPPVISIEIISFPQQTYYTLET